MPANQRPGARNHRWLMSKPKIGIYWCASCGGCEEAVVDLAEDILGVVEAVDIVLWPVAMDFKKKDVETMPDKSIVATLINGAIRTSEQEEMAPFASPKKPAHHRYGACAHTGGIPGLANQFSREQLLRFVYEETPTMVNEGKTRPQTSFQNNGHRVTLPEFRNGRPRARSSRGRGLLHPRFPPTPRITKPPSAQFLKGSSAQGQCARAGHCPLRRMPAQGHEATNVSFTEFKRPHLTQLDPDLCFLAQGIVCMGPARAAAAKPLAPAATCPAPAVLTHSRVRDQVRRFFRRCAPTWRRRTRRKSGRSKPASLIPSAPSTATASPRVSCVGKVDLPVQLTAVMNSATQEIWNQATTGPMPLPPSAPPSHH